MYKVLDILSNSMKMVRGTITILNPLRNEINIEVAHGLAQSTMNRVKYKLGEGVTGKVIETGKPVAIPKISEEPLFLDRTASRKKKQDREHSFICVPIKKGKQVIGALSVDRPYQKSYALKSGQKLLAVIATSALELGVDVGGLDATVSVGFPGTIASLWQQAGRAGRGTKSSLAVLIGLDDPLDQYFMRHPTELFGLPHEHALINPNNVYILEQHLPCAAHEYPLGSADEVRGARRAARSSGRGC